MGRNDVVRAGVGLLAVAGLVLTTAGACGGDDEQHPGNHAPTSVPPGDGVPNDGDGDADG